MCYGRHVLSTTFSQDTRRWRVTANNRFAQDEKQASEVRDFDALVLSDKLLVLPNLYAVLPETLAGPLSLPPLSSDGCVVLLIALDRTKLGKSDTCEEDWDVLEARGLPGGGVDAPVHLIVHESKKPQRDSSDELDLWVVRKNRQKDIFLSPHSPRELVRARAPLSSLSCSLACSLSLSPPRLEVRALSDAHFRLMSPPSDPESTWLCALFEASVFPRWSASARRAARTLV